MQTTNLTKTKVTPKVRTRGRKKSLSEEADADSVDWAGGVDEDDI
jgi:hypothetical protein